MTPNLDIYLLPFFADSCVLDGYKPRMVSDVFERLGYFTETSQASDSILTAIFGYIIGIAREEAGRN